MAGRIGCPPPPLDFKYLNVLIFLYLKYEKILDRKLFLKKLYFA